jgi:hypothetical protein
MSNPFKLERDRWTLMSVPDAGGSKMLSLAVDGQAPYVFSHAVAQRICGEFGTAHLFPDRTYREPIISGSDRFEISLHNTVNVRLAKNPDGVDNQISIFNPGDATQLQNDILKSLAI